MIGLLDSEVLNPQVLNQLALKFVSKVYIQRETKQLYMMIQFHMDDEVVLEKVSFLGLAMLMMNVKL